MPFLALLGNPLIRKAIAVVAFVAALAIAYFAWAHHIREAAQAEIVAKYEAATAAEHQRRDEVIADAQHDAQQFVARISEQDKKNGILLAQISRLSAAHDRQRCLDRGAVSRLRQFGGDRQQAGDGARQPAR